MFTLLGLIAFCLIITSIISTSLVYQFKREYSPPLNDPNKIFESLFQNIIFIEVCIGTPIQCFNLNLEMSSYPIWIISFESKNHNTDQKTFDSSTSSSFQLKDNYLLRFNYDKYEKSYCAYEKLIINQQEVKDFFFLLATSFTDTPLNSGSIGLDIQNRIYDNTPGSNFIEQLKKKKVIRSYDFSFQYDQEKRDVGIFIIGEYPHGIDKELDKGSLVSIKPLSSGETLRWGIEFDSVESGGFSMNQGSKAVMKIEMGLIIGPGEYLEYISKHFFDDLLTKQLCQRVNFLKHLFGFKCDKNIDVSKLKELRFIIGDNIFTFDAENLFRDELDMKVFLIVFANKYYMFESADWTLGEPFFKKYLFVFNQDKKTMEYYRNKDQLGNNGNSNTKLSFFQILLWVTLFTLCLIAIFVSWRYYQRRKSMNHIKSKNVNDLLI